MTTMQLECFLAVAETLSFAKAANQLNVTQPAVTQQIRALEEELTVQLFNRTTRMVRLTMEGHIFLDDARNILRMMQFTKKRFEERREKESHPFSIGCHDYDELELLPEVLRKMAEKEPALHPVFQVIPFQHLYRLLAEEIVDVVIAFQEKEEKESYGTYVEFAKIPIVGVLSSDHPLAGEQSLSAEMLKKERLILVAPQKAPGCLNDVCRELAKDRAITDILLCDAPKAAALLAKAGFGAAIFPELTARDDPASVRIPLEGMEALSYGAYYKSVAGKPLLKLFLELCRKQFSFR